MSKIAPRHVTHCYGEGDVREQDLAERKSDVTLLLVEQEQILREALRRSLTNRGISVIGQTGDGIQAITLAQAMHPTVVLLDVLVPDFNGTSVATGIHQQAPNSRIIMFTEHLLTDDVARSFAAGALGFVWKGAAVVELVHAIRIVSQGLPFFSPAFSLDQPKNIPNAAAQWSLLQKLTRRQRQVLQLVADEKSNKEIAVNLGLAVKTVEKHRGALMEKLNIHSVAGLVRFAIRTDIVVPDDVTEQPKSALKAAG